LNLKTGSAFTSTSTPHGGNEVTIFTLYAPFAHFGMVIVPPGYIDPKVFATGSPYGATSVSGGKSDHPPTADDLQVARFQGARVAQVAKALKK
jgi:NAD(P)H dehydrogenase (quinone)